MNISNITPMQFGLILAAIVVVLGAVFVAVLQRRRTARLRSRFGPEYELTLVESGDRRTAEARLEQRTVRVAKLHPRALSSEERSRFSQTWARVQAHFVDAPAGAVTEADELLGDVMAARGYPIGDFEQRAADISVDHPMVTQNYRAGHEIAVRQVKGQASTEDLRRAMIHYRALFEDLVTDRRGDNAKEKKPVAADITDIDGRSMIRGRTV